MNVPDQYILRNIWDSTGSIKIAGISALAAFLMSQYAIRSLKHQKKYEESPIKRVFWT